MSIRDINGNIQLMVKEIHKRKKKTETNGQRQKRVQLTKVWRWLLMWPIKSKPCN